MGRGREVQMNHVKNLQFDNDQVASMSYGYYGNSYYLCIVFISGTVWTSMMSEEDALKHMAKKYIKTM